MKRLEIPQINACHQCPYLGKTTLIVEEIAGINIILYCKNKAEVSSSNSAMSVLISVSDTMLHDIESIPGWCPLPESEQSTDENHETETQH